MTNLRGKTALVTGASSGIGRAVALGLALRGTHCVLAARGIERLTAVFDAIAAAGGSAECVAFDLSDGHSMRSLSSAVGIGRERLDILVNCAGLHLQGAWDEMSEEPCRKLLDANVYGVFELTRTLLPLLIKAQGDVVFVNSSIVERDGRNAGFYAATKHALMGLADSLRAEVNERGVRVLSVYPGRTATPMQQAIHANERRVYRPARLLQPEDVAQAIIACLELADTAEVTELKIRPRYKQ